MSMSRFTLVLIFVLLALGGCHDQVEGNLPEEDLSGDVPPGGNPPMGLADELVVGQTFTTKCDNLLGVLFGRMVESGCGFRGGRGNTVICGYCFADLGTDVLFLSTQSVAQFSEDVPDGSLGPDCVWLLEDKVTLPNDNSEDFIARARELGGEFEEECLEGR